MLVEGIDMDNIVEIDGKKIGPGYDVFVIAELGINHNGDFDLAKQLIDKAIWAGAGAVKLQSYITEKRVSKDAPIFGILKQCEFSFDQQEKLFQYAHDKGITAFSTPFDNESVDFLSSVNVPCYKIASFDLVNKKLLEKVAAKGKPVIMSRGMASRDEIDEAMAIMNKSGREVILLHCISAYPVLSQSSLNLSTIRALQIRYQCPVGFSDHTLDIMASEYAVAAGASLIEKHFTLSRKSQGPDHALSTEPAQMKNMIGKIRLVSQFMGEPVWSSIPEEENILQYRRTS